MKLRIKGNSIRLRLSKPDVEKLAATNYLAEHTHFPGAVFSYCLHSDGGHQELSAEFNSGKIDVYIPWQFVQVWQGNDVVGIENKVRSGNNVSLHILVEKDFKCLDETGEDQSDNFENPRGG